MISDIKPSASGKIHPQHAKAKPARPPAESAGGSEARPAVRRRAKFLDHRWAKVLLTVAIVIVIAAVATLAATWYARKHQTLPSNIQKQLDFSPFLAIGPNNSGTKMSNFKYDSSSKVFSYILRPKVTQKLTVSEQASPPNFTEIPDLYTKLLNGLNQFGTVETFNGTAYLTRPKGGSEVAVLNNQGALVFIRSDSGDINSTQWKDIVETLSIYKIAPS